MPVAKAGTSQQQQACAACKHQRRRCAEDCALAPHSPADKPETFQNAHRLYGVKKMKEILEQAHEPQQKREAMQSLIYESDMSAKFPVTGCLGIINQLNFQLEEATKELYHVRAHLAAVCKYQINNPPPSDIAPHYYHSCPTIIDANGRLSGDRCIEDNHHVENGHYHDTVKPALRVQLQQPNYYTSNNNVEVPMASHQPYFVSSQAFPIPVQQEMDDPGHDHYYDDDIPFETVLADDHVGDKQILY